MRGTALISGLFCFGVHSASADPVTDVCLAYNVANVCECATETLKSEIGANDFDFYSAATATALERQVAGDSLVDAWDKATKEYASAANLSNTEALNQINDFGSAHRDAIKSCEG